MTADKQYTIAVSGLTKKFGTFTAVDNIDFNVKRGEIFGFIGANGAGKTTTMRMLCGLSTPTSGRGFVAGCDINTEYEQIKRHIGYMSQRFALYNNLSVIANIRFFGGIYGMSNHEIEDRASTLLDRLGMRALTHTKVSELPVGWKQKLAFMVATIHHPEVVFLDEPTGGVDPIVRRQFWELIHEASYLGTTFFVTTHYMDEAMYCNRVAVMVNGRISITDKPETIIANENVLTMDDAFIKIVKRTQKQK